MNKYQRKVIQKIKTYNRAGTLDFLPLNVKRDIIKLAKRRVSREMEAQKGEQISKEG